jgi:two-component system response regulator FixJ
MSTQRVTIAVVEDDAGVRTAMQLLLRSAGFGVCTFASAEEFLASAGRDTIECLIADVNLPGITGVELVKRMKAIDRAFPAVLVTGRDDRATLELMQQAESVPHLLKPFRDEALFEAIERVTMSR